MSRTLVRAAALVSVAAIIPTSGAFAHCSVGNRFFPATMNIDDPCVADELALPTVASFRNEDDPSGRELAISGEISKRITERFGVSLEGEWMRVKEADGHKYQGFENFATSFKYQFLTDPSREFVMSASLDVDWGGTGSGSIESEPYSVLTPTLFAGKGFGFLPDQLRYLKPLAITTQVGYAVPTHDETPEFEPIPRSLVWGGSVQYSMPYLKSAVEDVGLPDAVNRLIPIVEWSLETQTGNFDGEKRTTGTINPGLIYVADKFQISGEAIIPVNRESGDGVGGMGQLHFYLDDIFPGSYGRPLLP